MLEILPRQKIVRVLTMKLKVRYLFSTSSLGFFIHKLSENLETRKILAYVIKMQKNPQTRVQIFWIFTDVHRITRVESPICTPRTKVWATAALISKLSIRSEEVGEEAPIGGVL